jgi:CubicO group peptidase (beta-lactamase class C family)
MSRTVRVRLAALLTLLCTALPACGDGAAGCARTSGSVAEFVARTWPEGPGGTVMAARGGRLVYCRGVGAAGHTAGCDTVYDTMSLTKQFTAAAVLKLESQGRLRTGDRITRFLGHVPAGKRSITIGQLLTHTSGLPESLGDDYDPLSRDGMLAKALASRRRSGFHYSNTGYGVLAAIIEKVSGTSYERYLAAGLFAPAGMTRTGYVLPHWRRDRVAVEYDDRGRPRGRPFDHPWAADGPYWNLRGNGGLLSTARDLFRWQRALSGDRVLSARARRKLFAPRVAMPGPDGERYAYGWVVRGTGAGPVAWHDGGNGWSLAVLARSLHDGTSVFWVSNDAYRKGSWNLEDRQERLTLGILCRTRATTGG